MVVVVVVVSGGSGDDDQDETTHLYDLGLFLHNPNVSSSRHLN